MIDIQKAEKAFKDYLSLYDMNDEKVALKVRHTYGVVKASEYLSNALNLDEENTNLARLIALLHDIGRFEQSKASKDVYDNADKTFFDHGEYGVKILFEDGLIRNFVEENTYDIFNQLTKQVLTKENVTYSTSYTYDSRGNVTNVIESNETDGDITSIISLTYNDKNELLSVNDNGTLYTNTYSSNGMLTKYLGWNISYDMRNISSLNNGDTSIDFEYNKDEKTLTIGNTVYTKK